MIDKLKKHWFVVIVAIIFLVGIIFFTKEEAKTTVRKKRIDGKDIVAIVDDNNYSADDYNERLVSKYGDLKLYEFFEKSVVSSVESSDDLKEQAKEEAENLKKYIGAQNGTDGLNQIDSMLKNMGYDKGIDDLNLYHENIQKRNTIIAQHIESNYDKYAKDYVEKAKPRLVSHILVSMDDPEKPTAEEQKKIDDIEKALDEGKDFGEIAQELSDDSATAVNMGSLGYVDANSQLVEEFLEAALALKDNETSDWVQTNYGRHIIHIDAEGYDEIKEDIEFLNAIQQLYPKVAYEAIWNASKDLEIIFHDESIEQRLKSFMGMEVEE